MTEFPFKFTRDGPIFGKACEMLFRNWNKKSQIQHHVNSQSHNKNLSLKEKRNVMGERQSKVSKSNVLGRELCEVFLSAFLYVTQMSPKRVFEEIKLKSNQNLRKNYIQNFYHMYFDNQICINRKFHFVPN